MPPKISCSSLCFLLGKNTFTVTGISFEGIKYCYVNSERINNALNIVSTKYCLYFIVILYYYEYITVKKPVYGH